MISRISTEIRDYYERLAQAALLAIWDYTTIMQPNAEMARKEVTHGDYYIFEVIRTNTITHNANVAVQKAARHLAVDAEVRFNEMPNLRIVKMEFIFKRIESGSQNESEVTLAWKAVCVEERRKDV